MAIKFGNKEIVPTPPPVKATKGSGTQKSIEGWQYGVLDPFYHKRLIDNLDGVCTTARVLRSYVLNSMEGVSPMQDIKWVTNYRDLHKSGLAIYDSIRINERLHSIAGALIRNYIDVKLVSLMELDNDSLTPSCLIVPNFYAEGHGGKALPSWRLLEIHNLLLERQNQQKQTILGCWIPNPSDLRDYGNALNHLINTQYIRL